MPLQYMIAWCIVISCINFCTSITTFAVSMTVIPSRFTFLEGTLQSWLNQTIRPTKLLIFVPNKYKRFKRKAATSTEVRNNEYLYSILMKSSSLRLYLLNNTIQVIPLDHDYGPLTKFIGILRYLKAHGSDLQLPDYWIVGDDDVGYANLLLSKYDTALRKRNARCVEKNCSDYFGMTQFAETYRQQFKLTVVNPDGTTTLEPHRILHVQGVDTFIVPNVVAQSVLRLAEVLRIVDYLHAKCPESFYQDDYVISFILHIFNVEMSSIRKDDGLIPTYPIEGATKFNSQMHIDKKVNYREEVTKMCILNSVQYVYSVTKV